MIQIQNNKRHRIKHLSSDSHRSYIIEGKTIGDCEEELMTHSKKPIQPVIIIVGTILEPKDIVVYFDGVKYYINTYIEAIDISFKIFNIFNLQYPIASNLVGSFIQKYFYKIITKYDVHVTCLVSSLK